MAYFKYKGKKVYFKVQGKGDPLILIHGNTTSSKIFASITKPFVKKYKVILIDLPGHGKSERLEVLPIDFWYENALAVIELMKTLEIDKACLMGTGGGALVALNVALEFPERVAAVVADSFCGERSLDTYVLRVEEDVGSIWVNMGANLFWKIMHGNDWKKVVEQDTDIIKRHHQEVGGFFHKGLEELQCPVLLMGGLKDRYLPDIKEMYKKLEQKIPKSEVVLFENGRHPAILYCMKDSVDIVLDYLEKNT